MNKNTFLNEAKLRADPKKREAAKAYAQEHGLDISAWLSKYEQ